MDKNGKSDPYAVITSTFNKQRFKTKVCKKSLNPIWNETFDLYVSSQHLCTQQHNLTSATLIRQYTLPFNIWPTFHSFLVRSGVGSLLTKLSYVSQPTGEVHIKLWDWDRWSKDDFLGEVIIPVSSLANGQAVDKFYTVQNEPRSGKLKGQPAGQIKVTLHFPSGKVLLSTIFALIAFSLQARLQTPTFMHPNLPLPSPRLWRRPTRLARSWESMKRTLALTNSPKGGLLDRKEGQEEGHRGILCRQNHL